MKRISRFSIIHVILLGSLFTLTNSCNTEVDAKLLPVLTTSTITNITQNTAICGGNITSDGGSSVTVRGVCWSTKASPTIADNKTADGSGIGLFTTSITGLTAGTSYYVRAYANTSAGTGYGNVYQISTLIAVPTITDIDGNVYKTVKIGTQIWMAENLKVTKYRNGDAITNVTDETIWRVLSSGAYCTYNNSTANMTKYGMLYNGFAITDQRNIAPIGWHVASSTEWITLKNHLNNSTNNVAKSLASTTDWAISSKTGAIGNDLSLNNSTGFNALPCGLRDDYGIYGILGSGSYWSTIDAKYMFALLNDGELGLDGFNYKFGLSVRCIKD